ncbi:hypothetical protein P7C71_g618, partial [Lecanoromycetidae sp. Uapishka_2]
MFPIHQQSMITSLWTLFESGQYSDMTVICGPEEFKVHRAVEGQTNLINLAEDDPPSIRRMLAYLYIFDYDAAGKIASPAHYMRDTSDHIDYISKAIEEYKDAFPGSCQDYHALQMNHVVVYAVADKYDIPDLKQLAKTKLQKSLEGLTADPRAVFMTIFETTPDSDTGLRDVVADLYAEEIDIVMNGTEMVSLLLEHGDLGLGVIRRVLDTHKRQMAQEAAKNEALRESLTDLKVKVRLVHGYAADTVMPMEGGGPQVHSSALERVKRLRKDLRSLAEE